MVDRTTVRLPSDLLARIKRKAAAEGRTMASLLEEGARTVVAQGGKPPKRSRVVLPVSKATGGLLPGVNLGLIEEMEDQETVERMTRFK